ncbi:MAG: aconitate hydratase AcnA [Anaerolineales bacterium]|nr:aconitate hydratase AcnA [Anaerolineae bacterium]PWB52345.1 MAG: aconitate hydratase AcnA [Anaerolineales bacterium]
MDQDLFATKKTLSTSAGKYIIFSLPKLEQDGITQLSRLPYSIRILLESLVRHCNSREIQREDVINLANWTPNPDSRPAMPYSPARVIMQDFTGVPAIVELAAMREAMKRIGGDPKKINPLVPVDLVIDHSVQVDFFASADALVRNAELEFQRNHERYEFLRWGQNAFTNFRVVPPATGIVHQVNLEYLARVVMTQKAGGEYLAFPDTLVGTDSHTTMINGLGVVGWGVGGIEAEAAMLGQPIDMLIPDVIGVKLFGQLSEGVTATDLTLTITQLLRKKGVVDKFVEFFGSGLSSLSLPDRATIANMAPEYGATIGYFPIDNETLRYLKLTGRSTDTIELVESYCKEQGLFRTDDTSEPKYTSILEVDLGSIESSLAGPKRPQDKVSIFDIHRSFQYYLSAPVKDGGFELKDVELSKEVSVGTNGHTSMMSHGAVVLAAITSCTNTSNPSVMIAAGLLAKKAVERGLKVRSYVKTSLAPGSRVVTEYLTKAGLLEPLGKLGFNVVGYGCTTCIGNSGPLPGEVVKAITSANLVAVSVLSGNRNFEGRIHPYVRANYLASPPLVVAFALAGTINIDLKNEPIGEDANGQPVFLRDLWPTNQEVAQVVEQNVSAEMFIQKYQSVFTGNETWNAIRSSESELYSWDNSSTYIQEPPFFIKSEQGAQAIRNIKGARVLAFLGDSITTDHISPAGTIPADSPAGKYLIANGVQPREFNSYGARRGNDRVMTRGTFANIRLKNRLVPGIEGGVTLHLPDGEQVSIYDAAMKYAQEGVPLVVVAGKDYGSGSSRDWAAKGTKLLGIKAVIAESYERIHRSNLVGMGVLPLQFLPGDNAGKFNITGREVFNIEGLDDQITPNYQVTVRMVREDQSVMYFKAIARLNTIIEVDYYRNGGVLNTVLKKLR